MKKNFRSDATEQKGGRYMVGDTKEVTLSSSIKGRHAELLATTALMAQGFTVSEPVSPEAFDMSIKRAGDKRTFYVQVKTASVRDEPRYNGAYVVVKGAKNNGAVYSHDEVDYFIAVYRGDVYMFPNREISEYWIRPDDMAVKWTKLSGDIHSNIEYKGVGE